MTISVILTGAIGILAGALIGWFFRQEFSKRAREAALHEAQQIRTSAETETKEAILKAKEEALAILEDAKREDRQFRLDLRKREETLTQRDQEISRIREGLARQTQELAEHLAETDRVKQELTTLKDEEVAHLANIAQLSEEEAKEKLVRAVEQKHAETLQRRLKTLQEEGKAAFTRRAQDILLGAMQRYGASHAVDAMTSAVSLPSEDIKGRIIGKEGRNIKAFERATGCEVLVDETPNTIVISSFDPIRREVAKRALERLVEDGRIQPARIEELVEAARTEVEEIVRKAGVDAAEELGMAGLDPRLVYLIGRLRFRTSFGQNVLQHSLEAAYLAAMIASELHADVYVAKFGALVHDIGKAVDHEVEGTHVEIGRKLLRRFNVDEAVIKAMQSHHEEYPFETPESIIVKVADALSASRPGARRDTVENYLKRLSDLERVANSFDGIEKSYAIQAGREVRIFVLPEQVDDAGAERLAQDIAKKIEQELHYPGEIKVNVIREKRVVEYAK